LAQFADKKSELSTVKAVKGEKMKPGETQEEKRRGAEKRSRLAKACEALNPLVTRLLSFFGLNALINLFAVH